MKYLSFLIFLVIFNSCKQENKQLTAQEIVNKAIDTAGGAKYENATIHFSFRGTKYSSKRKNGQYELTRSSTDSLGQLKDVLSNTGFQRFRNETKVELPDSMVTKYANSINSVHYFVQLPYGLNAGAVNKELVGETEINNTPYYQIKITFKQEGGGTDHEDVYMYWINQNSFTIDYFAYKFFTGKGGIRFREAYNPRTIEDLRFVDYKNYKVEPWKNVDLKTLGNLFSEDKLELLSDIKTEDITVNPSAAN
ncbi:DUF6503 family protein [Aequorivita marina]|uniref:DUF6503 family protein n=1 Tax=Aequorivita marina TaxID=3073654 RepID=UPI00287497C1|nr:DUF6503 family protein [Aequorivita sp. S2608]MDS1299602.1 DUF6503 family protein [Aequorivita sp. S2608]